MILSFFYLALFLLAGFIAARRTLPNASLAVSLPLGCGYSVAMLAAFPAIFALAFGFGKTAAFLAALLALAVLLSLLHGLRMHRLPQDPDRGAMWICLLPVFLVTR